jgi:hypothetical protein
MLIVPSLPMHYSINAKEAKTNDDPNQKPFHNITYIFIWDTAGQALFHNGTDRTPIFRKKEALLRDSNWITL